MSSFLAPRNLIQQNLLRHHAVERIMLSAEEVSEKSPAAQRKLTIQKGEESYQHPRLRIKCEITADLG